MAGRIAGITIEIGGDTSNLQKSLKGVDAQLKTTQANLKDIEKLLKMNPASTELLTQKQKALKDAVQQTKDRLQQLKDAQKGVAQGTPEWDALQREIIATEQDLQRAENALRQFGSVAAQQLKAAGQKMKDFGNKVQNVGTKVSKAGESLTKKVTVPIVAGFTAAVKTTADFDKSMSQVAATMGVSVDEIGELSDFAREMGASTAFSATEAADALNYMALAGYDAETSMNMLPTVLNLAAAGGIDLATASDMVTDAQSALGLTAEETTQMVDQMAKASSKSNTSVAQLGEAFLKIGATARNLSGETTELATVLGVLADNGIKGAEGGTHLRNIILSLQTPTKAGTKALKKLGMSYKDMYDEAGNMRSIPEIMQQMSAAMEGMDQKSKDAIVSGIFNKADLAAVNALLGTSAERFAELETEISNADGSAKQMADTQLDNFSGQITLLKSALQELAISLGNTLTPMLRKAAEWIQGLVDKFNALSPHTKELITKVGLIVAAIGPLAIVIGKVITAVGSITKVVGGLMGSLGGPWTLIIAAVIALGILIYKNWDKIKAKAIELKDKVVEVWNTIKNKVVSVATAIKDWVVNAWNTIKTGVTSAIETVRSTVETVWNAIKTAVTTVVTAIVTVVVMAWNGIKTAVTTVVNGIKTGVTTAWNGIKTAITTVGNGIKTAATTAWNATKTAVSTAANGAKDAAVNAWNTMKTGISTAMEALAPVVGPVFDAMKTKVSTVVTSISGRIQNLISKFNALKTGIQTAIAKIKAILSGEIKFPNIKLPHIKITDPGELPWGIAGKGRPPQLGIDWYRKAYDNPIMFSSPTVIGTPSGLKGFGDGSGAEIVMGLDKLRELVGGMDQNVTVQVVLEGDARGLFKAVQRTNNVRTKATNYNALAVGG